MARNDITQQGVMSDADPMQVTGGDQLAGYNNLIEYINVLKGHPITATKQLRNLGRIAEGVSSKNPYKGIVQLPPVPWLRMTAEDYINYPYLRDKAITHVGLNGNNRENFYSYLNQPVLGEEVTKISPNMRDMSIEQAISSSKWEEPQQLPFLNADKLPFSEKRAFQGDFTDQARKYWGDIEAGSIPTATSGLIGQRPFMILNKNGGWMQEMVRPSGNGGVNWQPLAESQALATAKNPLVKSMEDYQDWIRNNDPNPVRRWINDQMMAPEARVYKGYQNFDPDHKMLDLPDMNTTTPTIPSYLDTRFRAGLPGADLPIDLQTPAIRTMSSQDEMRQMLEMIRNGR